MIVFRSYQDLVVRDLECYCDLYPSKCPLSDYTPNTEKPKKPWGFDWKPGNYELTEKNWETSVSFPLKISKVLR